jgi:hypothetical protein
VTRLSAVAAAAGASPGAAIAAATPDANTANPSVDQPFNVRSSALTGSHPHVTIADLSTGDAGRVRSELGPRGPTQTVANGAPRLARRRYGSPTLARTNLQTAENHCKAPTDRPPLAHVARHPSSNSQVAPSIDERSPAAAPRQRRQRTSRRLSARLREDETKLLRQLGAPAANGFVAHRPRQTEERAARRGCAAPRTRCGWGDYRAGDGTVPSRRMRVARRGQRPHVRFATWLCPRLRRRLGPRPQRSECPASGPPGDRYAPRTPEGAAGIEAECAAFRAETSPFCVVCPPFGSWCGDRGYDSWQSAQVIHQ